MQVRVIKRLFVEQFLAFVAGHVQDRISNNELAVTQKPISTEANLAFGRLFIGFWRRQSTEVSRLPDDSPQNVSKKLKKFPKL